MAAIARRGAQAILLLGVVAIGARLATVPIAAPTLATRAAAASPTPRPARPIPIGVDPAKLASAAPAPTPLPAPAPAPAPAPPQPRTAPAGTVIRRVLDTHGAIRFGDWFWDEAGVPAGPILITVDTKASVLSIFRGGYEIGTTAVIYGDDGMPTPLGVFPITQKDAHHVSNLYHAPMPYMLRLTNDGVSIHGSPIAADYATHGCIGVPVAFAKKLFGATKLGDRVIVTRGETLDLGGRVKAI
ncbi:L,D-transpeptidase family protein [Sphingomonas sp. GC_Shp_6]|uniref:L,D-transpeptidase family protein n=2 Tax=unclassified Sphingomonas TaxID=196159 RepID=UPI00226A3CAF|nr:L,D-transpeptidase family protein [Sphingomonas sp. GC_Shp_6]